MKILHIIIRRRSLYMKDRGNYRGRIIFLGDGYQQMLLGEFREEMKDNEMRIFQWNRNLDPEPIDVPLGEKWEISFESMTPKTLDKLWKFIGLAMEKV